MKGPKPGSDPMRSAKTGNLPTHNVGDGVPGKPPGLGHTHTHGSYTNNPRGPGTDCNPCGKKR